MSQLVRLGHLSKCNHVNRIQTLSRTFSLQATIDNVVETHQSLFRTISESPPVEICQNYLLNIHEITGLPWWASIVVSTIVVRSTITLPLAVYQQIVIAKLENIKRELPEIAEELKMETTQAVKMFRWDERTAKMEFRRAMKQQYDQLVIRDNCHPLKTLVLMAVQLPLWISLSVSLRNLVYMLPGRDLNAQLTYTELSVGGVSFIPNLTIADSSWIFPIGLGILNLAIIELQILSKTTAKTRLQNVTTQIFRGLALFMVPVAASVPSCLALYWTTSSAFGLIQNLVLMHPKVRRLCRIPATDLEPPKPYHVVIDNLKNKFK